MEILKMMPLWHHATTPGKTKRSNNGKKAPCLRGNHADTTIGDGLNVARRLGDTLHAKTSSCICDDCDDDRDTRGYEDPHACATKAMSRLGQIHARWMPKPEDDAQQAEEPTGEDESRELFRPPIPITSLSEVSAQKYASDAMNKKLQHWEHEGWVGVPNRDVLRCVAAKLKARKAPTFFEVATPDTPTRALCRLAAAAAKRAARAPNHTEWDMTLPQGMALPGMSLQGNRQKHFYRAIREKKTKKLMPRAATVKNLEIIREPRTTCLADE
ncbi:hypothetical protein B0H19DRAFT_1264717 [Mycena capillaripes]|nr:hypothetical protein B0H19DRAFT_1264717 [Mycena capillaripes]